MSKGTVFVGMDVHAETIAVEVAEGRDEVRSVGTIANCGFRSSWTAVSAHRDRSFRSS